MRKEETEVQVFNGEEYFLYESLKKDDIKYCYFAKMSNPNDLLVAIDDNEIYEILVEDDLDYAMKLYYEKHNII